MPVEDRQIPTQAPADRPTFTLYSDGREVSGTVQVFGAVVTRRVNRVAEAVLLIHDGSAAAEDFPVSNAEDFAPGREIEIHAGYHSDEARLFRGLVIRHAIEVRRDAGSMLRVECKDAAVTLTVGRANRYFYEATDQDVIEQIASAAGLDTEVASTAVTHTELVQFNALDWDFIIARAEANGLLVTTADGTLQVAPPDPDQAPRLALRYGGNLIAFEAAMDARDQSESVHAFAWDAANQELMDIEGTGAPNGAPGNVAPADLAGVVGLRQLDLRHGGQRSDLELQAWADAQLLKSRLAKVRGRARVQGYGEIQPGDVVDLAGVGDRFNGTAFVAGVRHEINVRNWETDIEFGLPPEWLMDVFDDVPAHPAGGLLPPVEGLQIGLVTALEGDPDGEYRVQVRVPMIDAAEEGVWARVALLDAGADRGTYIRPEIGDEVILGFLGGDPRNPVILGGVHSSAAAAPIEPTDDNHEKGVVTRSGIRFVFDDETTEATLETPNGNTVVVSDDAGSVTLADEHGNTVVLDADGVAIDSAGDITLSASGDVTVEGTNVSLAATADVTAEASANATLSGSAQTEITGSIVKIN